MSDVALSIIPFAIAIVLAPLSVGVIRSTKAFFAGRRGFSVFQMYRDLFKLLHKGIVYSASVSWLFKLAPLAGLAASLIACAWLPFGVLTGLFSFTGGFVLIAYLFGSSRFMAMLASLDTASAFEGMGANREALFSVFAETALLLGFGAVIVAPGNSSLENASAQPDTRFRIMALQRPWPPCRSSYAPSRKTRESRSTTRQPILNSRWSTKR